MIFFFSSRRRHTRYWRDWSSDVCSSDLRRAERWIHMDYFIFKADRIGVRFAGALKEKAREGVAVRVSYDWMGNFRVPDAFWRDLQRAGVETRVVNAPALGKTFGLIARDHRKILGVDGHYASVGGCASPTSGWAAPPRRACPTATPPLV